MPSVAMVTIWKDFGHSTVLLLAGLRIPKFTKPLPLIRPTPGASLSISVCPSQARSLLVLLTSIMSFQVFCYLHNDCRRPYDANNCGTSIYVTAFDYLKMGRASYVLCCFYHTSFLHSAVSVTAGWVLESTMESKSWFWSFPSI